VSITVRIAVVLLAVLIVIVIARLVGRLRRPSHPPIDLTDFAENAGVVVFTSTDCSNCREALAKVESLGVPLREVTWELEPTVFEELGVQSVPLTAVVDADRHVELLVAGVPRGRSLGDAVRRAGLISQ